jgi:aminopeptidase-like protein
VLPPETIGPIVYLHQNREIIPKIVGGYTFVSVGDSGPKFHYRSSYSGSSVTDRAMRHALAHSGFAFEFEPFDIRPGTTGNEKAYNSPGMAAPVGSLRRTHVGEYKEHVTSADDMTFISAESRLAALHVSWMAIQALERDQVYRNLYYGEPFLTGYGIYPHGKSNQDIIPWDYLKAFVDGRNSLIEIADRAGVFVAAFDEVVEVFLAKGLIERVQNGQING